MSLGNMRVLCQSRRRGQVAEIGLRSHLHYPHVHIWNCESRLENDTPLCISMYLLTYGLWREVLSWGWRARESDGTGNSLIKNLRVTLGKVCVEGRWIPTSALFGSGCQGHNLILSLLGMSDTLTGLMVSRSEACGWLILIEKPQRRFGLGKKKKKSEESKSVSNCVRDGERHSRKACTDTHFWTEPWCKANQSDQHPVSAQSRHTYESIFISMARTADDSQEQRIADLEMIARCSGFALSLMSWQYA